MQPHELSPFRDALVGTFDALGGRPPGAAGIDVWFRTLRGFPLGDVVDALDGWVARNSRAPTPAGLADACRERGIERRERQSEAWKRDEHNGPHTMGATEGGRRAPREIRALVAGMRRPQHGLQRDWAHRILDRHVAHDPVLAPIAFDCACDALGYSPEERAQLRALRSANAQTTRAALGAIRSARESASNAGPPPANPARTTNDRHAGHGGAAR